MQNRLSAAWAAWLLAALYYFYQYVLRAAPAVMMPQLSEAFGLSAIGVASLVGVFYYGYAPFCLVAGIAMDRMGPRVVMSAGVAILVAGSVLFGIADPTAANIGRFLQGVGGAGAMVGAVYIASRNFPASSAATLIGATQMFGMAGGSAGQFLVGPAIAGGLGWNQFWFLSAVGGVLLATVLWIKLPKQEAETRTDDWFQGSTKALAVVFKNPQSILCGVIAGLLFIPTNIFGMIWGVRFLQEAHGFEYGDAVMRSATVPLGWIIGCPLLGMLSDRLGRRKPVIAGGSVVLLTTLAWILYGRPDAFPPYVLGLVAGLASGSAMVPFTVIKEANPPDLSGTATGVINLLAFAFSAVFGPVFGWIMQRVTGADSAGLQQYQMTFQPLLYGVALAIALTFLLKETGPAVRAQAETVRTE